MRGASSITCFRESRACNWTDVNSAGEEERLQQLGLVLSSQKRRARVNSVLEKIAVGRRERGPDPAMAVGADVSIQRRNSLPEIEDGMVTM